MYSEFYVYEHSQCFEVNITNSRVGISRQDAPCRGDGSRVTEPVPRDICTRLQHGTSLEASGRTHGCVTTATAPSSRACPPATSYLALALWALFSLSPTPQSQHRIFACVHSVRRWVRSAHLHRRPEPSLAKCESRKSLERPQTSPALPPTEASQADSPPSNSVDTPNPREVPALHGLLSEGVR